MLRKFCNFINQLLFPSRVAKGLPCNDGLWWFIPAIMQALASAGSAIGAGAGAIGSAVGGAASAIGSGIGGLFGGGSAGGLGSAATASINAAAPVGTMTAATPIASGLTTAGGVTTASGGTTLGEAIASKGLMSGITKAAKDQLLPMGEDIAKEKMKGQQEAPVSIDNSISMQAPKTGESSKAPTTGGAQSIPPEMLMQLMQMMKQKQAQAQGTTAPIANNFPGGYY